MCRSTTHWLVFARYNQRWELYRARSTRRNASVRPVRVNSKHPFDGYLGEAPGASLLIDILAAGVRRFSPTSHGTLGAARWAGAASGARADARLSPEFRTLQV